LPGLLETLGKIVGVIMVEAKRGKKRIKLEAPIMSFEH